MDHAFFIHMDFSMREIRFSRIVSRTALARVIEMQLVWLHLQFVEFIRKHELKRQVNYERSQSFPT